MDLILHILITKEADFYQAHCLELDLVDTAQSLEEVQEGIISLCRAHIEFSLQHDNLDHLFSPAPREIWNQYFLAAHDQSCHFISREFLLGAPLKLFLKDKIQVQEIFCHAA